MYFRQKILNQRRSNIMTGGEIALVIFGTLWIIGVLSG